jgi:cytochrome c oxidase subunit IV
MDRVLTIFINVWVALFVLANLAGIVGQFYLHGFSGGLSYVQEIYNPFNIANLIVSIVSLSPALGAYLWRENRRKKQP